MSLNHAEPEQQEGEEQFLTLMGNIRKAFLIKGGPNGAVVLVNPAHEMAGNRTCRNLYDDFRNFVAAAHAEDCNRSTRVTPDKRESDDCEREPGVARTD